MIEVLEMMMSGSGLQREVAFALSQSIVTGLLPYEIEDLKKVFQEFDQDGEYLDIGSN